MPEKPEDLRRNSLRLPEYDYSQPGLYFITLVTWQRECLFGQVTNDEMILNDIGFLAKTEWDRLANRFPGIELDYFVFKPNHLHAIVGIDHPAVRTHTPLGAIVGAYKSTVARLVNGFRHTLGAPVWQRNFYEHVIRNENDLARIREYIQNNPCNWTLDNENPGSLLP